MKTTDQTEARAFETSDRTPTIAFEQSEETLALPYDGLEGIQYDYKRCIRIVFEKHEVSLHGSNLDKLFEELAAFRVKEVLINGGAAAKALGDRSGRCLIDRIEINPAEGERAAA